MVSNPNRLSIVPPSTSSSSQPKQELYNTHPPASANKRGFSRGSSGSHLVIDASHSSPIKSPNGHLSSNLPSSPSNPHMMVPPPRLHLPHSASQDIIHTRSNNRLMMVDPKSSFPASRSQWRESLQPSANIDNEPSGKQANRRSQYPMRSSAEPTNLINSVRESPFSSRPSSMVVDSRRVVTGILESALPVSSRPVPVNTLPVKSMTIFELEQRHKAALQRLQTHSAPAVPQTSVPSQPQRRPRPKRPTANVKPESSSSASSNSKKVDNSVKPADKPPISASHRRSFFGFLNLKDGHKHDTAAEGAIKPKNSPPDKKQKEASKAGTSEPDEEDEDVPLAQLLKTNRRASHNPQSRTESSHQKDLRGPNVNLPKSYSASGIGTHDSALRQMAPLTGVAGQFFPSEARNQIERPKQRRSSSYSPASSSRRGSKQFDPTASFEAIPEDPSMPLNSRHPVPHHFRPSSHGSQPSPHHLQPDSRHFQPPPWLEMDSSPSSDQPRVGPRPLIFEDEAKAIRNSRKLWA